MKSACPPSRVGHWWRGSLPAFASLGWSLGWSLLLALSAGSTACSEDDSVAALDVAGGSPGNPPGGGSLVIESCEGPPEPDATGLCGNDVVPVLVDKPNLYFVLDSSGSMAESLGQSVSKLQASKQAIVQLLRETGHRINYGLTMFPSYLLEEGCEPGVEVFETREGDAVRCAGENQSGPVLIELIRKLTAIEPQGGTPTAATLRALAPELKQLPGSTSVILLTDGAPNCNEEAFCTAQDCSLNIEQANYGGPCDETRNCCAAAGGWACVDRDPTLAVVQELAEADIRTFVIGVPGSEYYSALLEAMAVAGGTARVEGDTAYYATTDTESLDAALRAIGAKVVTTCEIQVADEHEPDLMNVYLDASLLEYDPADGWSYEAGAVRLNGAACDELRSGDVLQVQVVSGCPTVLK